MYKYEVKLRGSYLSKFPLFKSIKENIIIESLIYASAEKDFFIYEIKNDGGEYFKAKYCMALEQGVKYKVEGTVEKGKYNENVLNIQSVTFSTPKSKEDIISFLKSLKGINEKAEDIYEEFKENSVDVLKNDPMAIAKRVKGVGPKSVEKWKEQIDKLEESYTIMGSFYKLGLNTRQINGILKETDNNYGIIDEIEKNPYKLMDLVRGYSFKRCDEIALKIGIKPNDPFRIRECVAYLLSSEAQNGHCFVDKNEIVDLVRKYLLNQVDSSEIANNLSLSPNLYIEDDRVYLKNIYNIENFLAYKIKNIAQNELEIFNSVERDLDFYLSKKGYNLEEKQREAVLNFCKSKGGFFILNGGAGCGKTFTLNIILDLLTFQYKKNKEDFEVKILAPTGKASKVASKSTNREATTIHRGVKYNPDTGPEFGLGNPIIADCIVVDESSMLDVYTAKMLFEAISDNCKVIFLGDTNQLPSIGAGNILKDLIESPVVKKVTLNIVKRQGKQSGIHKNALNIIDKKMVYSRVDTKDAYVKDVESPINAIKELIMSFEKLSKVFAIEDLQILAPQKSGIVGVNALNYIIQQIYNKNPYDNKIFNKKVKVLDLNTLAPKEDSLYFKTGDKVIHMKNNYSMKWYMKDKHLGLRERLDIVGITNGECGVVYDIIIDNFSNTKTMVVKYGEDEYVQYENNFDEIDHAYALTIHKSQGSQWKAVVVLALNSHKNMLNNNLLYTGYTRAEKFMFLLGQKDVISYAINNTDIRKRNTSLKERLNQ